MQIVARCTKHLKMDGIILKDNLATIMNINRYQKMLFINSRSCHCHIKALQFALLRTAQTGCQEIE